MSWKNRHAALGWRPSTRVLASLGFASAIAACLAVAAEDGEPPSQPVYLREVYVPYEEFVKRSRADPGGIVMNLAEYRSLVLKGLARLGEEAAPPLPPIEAVATRAEHHGKLEGTTALFRTVLHVQTAREKWVRCDLGPLPAALGAVLVDGEPGWILKEQPAKNGKGKKTKKTKRTPEPRAFLLLRGKSDRVEEHRVELTFSLPATKTEERWSLTGFLPRAVTARLTLDVPGHAEAHADPPYLETKPASDGERTELRLSLGTAERFALNWRQKRAAGESEALLAADHRLTLLVRRGDPVFVWDAAVSIRRQKTARLSLREGAGMEVSRVSGDQVHSWTRDGEVLRVLLSEPLVGTVNLRFEGFLNAALEADGSRRFAVGAPDLDGAYWQSGKLGICDPALERLEITDVVNALEIGLGDATVPALGPAPVARLFSFDSPEARVRFRALPRPAAFSYQAAVLVRFLESAVTLDGLYSLRVVHGRLYRLRLSLPTSWRFENLQAVASKEEPAALSYEVVSEDENDQEIEITMARALEAGTPLELHLRLELADWDADLGWPRRERSIRVPVFEAAERARMDLGIAVAASMDAERIEQGTWRRIDRAELPVPEESEQGSGTTLVSWKSLDPQRLKQLGLDVRELTAGLSSTRPTEPVSVALRHRRSRGEYQAVSYLLGLRRRVRLRSDILLAVMDRPVERISVRLPVPEEVVVHVIGQGVKEGIQVAAVDGGSDHTIRFEKPWVGSRRLRLEYEVDHAEGTEVPIPSLGLLGPDDSTFSGEQGIVFQSLGPVELDTDPGDSLLATTFEDLPELGRPWQGGRLLFAYRFGKGEPGTFGTFSTRVHPHQKVLSSVARELNLTTVTGTTGVSRTRVQMFLTYAEKERLEVELEADSRLLAVEIDGEPVRAVWRGDSPGRWSVPLPPRSHVQMVLVYETPDTSGPKAAALGDWGSWRGRGPRLHDVEVGTCRWRFYQPEGYRFVLDEGESNLRARDPERRVTTFAGAFFGRLLQAKWPLFTSLRQETRERPAAAPALSQSFQVARRNGLAGSVGNALQRLSPSQAGPQSRAQLDSPALGFELVPEGLLLEAAKIGGDPELVLNYRTFHWWNFSKRAVFILTLLGGLCLALQAGRRPFYLLVGWGLFVGTLLPFGLGWESPFLMIPFCEGLVVLLFAAAALKFARVVASWAHRRILSRRRAPAVAPMLLVALCLVLASRSLHGQSDEVLIPYDPADLSSLETAAQKVFLSSKKFRELWILAHPEEKPAVEKLPAELVVGNASYELIPDEDEDTYRLTGEVALNVLTEDWVSLALPFEEAQLVCVSLDGKEIGATARAGHPVVVLKESGLHWLGLELSGPVERKPGVFTVATGILAGTATRLTAELRAGARPEFRGAPAGVSVEEKGEASFLRADLGAASRFELTWSFPKIAGKIASRLESVSYTIFSLTAEGYGVERLERVQVAGEPLDTFEYRVVGDWEIADVSAPELVEWAVAEKAGEKRLSLFFSRPRAELEARVSGLARVAADPVQAATLALVDAIREETFLGLRHGTVRRWRPEALGGARRVSRAELKRVFPRAGDPPERLYHIYGSGQRATVAAQPREGTVTLDTHSVAVVGTERLILTTRSRFQVTAPATGSGTNVGPFRQELTLPAGWKPRAAQGETLRSWEATPLDGGGTRLVFFFEGRATSGTEVTWSAELSYESLPDPLTLPRIESETFGQALREETIRLAVAAAEGVELSFAEAAGLAPLPLEGARTWVNLPERYSYRFAFRSTGPRPRYTLSLEAKSPPSRVRAVVVLFIRAREDSVLVNGRLLYRLEQGAMESFGFRLPPDAELVSLDTRNQRSRSRSVSEDGRQEVNVRLVSPVFREQTVDIAYVLERGDGPVELSPLTLLDGGAPLVEVDQYVGVVQGARLVVSAEEIENLVTLPAEQLPFLPAGVTAENLAPTFRATRSDWSLKLRQESVGKVEELAALIKLAEIVTVLASDGTLRSEVTYTLRNKSLQFLKVELPGDTKLWGVTVDGSPVLVSTEKETDPSIRRAQPLKIPLERVGPGDPDLKVVLVYSQPAVSMPALYGSLDLQVPGLPETKVFETLWHLELPAGYTVSTGGMREVTASFRHTRKVENLLEQIELLSQTEAGTQSVRLKRHAQENLKRLEQALSDSVQDLEQTLAQAPQADVPRADKLQQFAAGRSALKLGQKRRDELRKTQQELAEEQQAEPAGSVEPGFSDSLRFLENNWRSGRNAPPPVPDEATADASRRRTTPRVRRGDREGKEDVVPFLEIDSLQKGAFRGLLGTALASGDRAVEQAEPTRVVGSKLTSLKDTSASPITPGLETPPSRGAERSRTFHHPGADARLELTLTPEGIWLDYGALLLLVLVPAFLVWRRLRGAAG